MYYIYICVCVSVCVCREQLDSKLWTGMLRCFSEIISLDVVEGIQHTTTHADGQIQPGGVSVQYKRGGHSTASHSMH
jgi:hypothetical protein